MKRAILGLLISVVPALGQEWRLAEPGWTYGFPRDHHSHPEFKTEWWYFTGNLLDEQGRRFGYELTFFRHGIIPPARRAADLSPLIVSDLKFAHFTITDSAGRRFLFQEKTSRGAFGEAGFDRGDTLAWIEDWSLSLSPDREFTLTATMRDGRIDLVLTAAKAPVVHGENGVSAKAAGEGHASHYYSITRLRSGGWLQVQGKRFRVQGTSWFDHEWATNQLAPHQLGWNWLCLQFNDTTELMIYQMRRDDGSTDPASSGTFIAADGTASHLGSGDFSMTKTGMWHSGKTGADYPIESRVQVPSCGIDARVRPIAQDQELVLAPLTYWEGAVDASGTKSGVGYLELTGYAGKLSGLNR